MHIDRISVLVFENILLLQETLFRKILLIVRNYDLLGYNFREVRKTLASKYQETLEFKFIFLIL